MQMVAKFHSINFYVDIIKFIFVNRLVGIAVSAELPLACVRVCFIEWPSEWNVFRFDRIFGFVWEVVHSYFSACMVCELWRMCFAVAARCSTVRCKSQLMVRIHNINASRHLSLSSSTKFISSEQFIRFTIWLVFVCIFFRLFVWPFSNVHRATFPFSLALITVVSMHVDSRHYCLSLGVNAKHFSNSWKHAHTFDANLMRHSEFNQEKSQSKRTQSTTVRMKERADGIKWNMYLSLHWIGMKLAWNEICQSLKEFGIY